MGQRIDCTRVRSVSREPFVIIQAEARFPQVGVGRSKGRSGNGWLTWCGSWGRRRPEELPGFRREQPCTWGRLWSSGHWRSGRLFVCFVVVCLVCRVGAMNMSSVSSTLDLKCLWDTQAEIGWGVMGSWEGLGGGQGQREGLALNSDLRAVGIKMTTWSFRSELKSSEETEFQRKERGFPTSILKERLTKGMENEQSRELGRKQENVITCKPRKKKIQEYYPVSLPVAWKAGSSPKYSTSASDLGIWPWSCSTKPGMQQLNNKHGN